ncbi:hypothetical protein L798_05480 [Zootermopsis nevadensis]|uniref:Uncharacterized protein n=1 Tax=Zootermopsis nevadensis TaxID=136037 RepID=A0A067RI53_ZOONE|nr:hypothetical protein L798_05480 [Zootermopsis nevadensis]
MSNIVLDDNTNHDSSSVSASTSNNEESLDSCSNDRFVIGSATKKTSLPPSFLIGSDEDSDHRSLQVNSPFSVGKVDIKYDQQTKLRSSTNENRPIFSVSFRNQDVARKYKASIKTFLKDLIAKNDPDNEEDTSDLELDVWEAEEDGEDSQDHDSVDSSSLFKVDTHPTLKDNLDVPAYNHGITAFVTVHCLMTLQP